MHPDWEIYTNQDEHLQKRSYNRPHREDDGRLTKTGEARDPNDERVTIWNKQDRRKLSGNSAPFRKNVDEYIAQHPEWEIYTNQPCEHRKRKRKQVEPPPLPFNPYAPVAPPEQLLPQPQQQLPAPATAPAPVKSPATGYYSGSSGEEGANELSPKPTGALRTLVERRGSMASLFDTAQAMLQCASGRSPDAASPDVVVSPSAVLTNLQNAVV